MVESARFEAGAVAAGFASSRVLVISNVVMMMVVFGLLPVLFDYTHGWLLQVPPGAVDLRKGTERPNLNSVAEFCDEQQGVKRRC
jgi:hypothetical protein